MPQEQTLKNKVAVITGGSRGIGFSLAQAFVREGCNVVITGRDAKALKTAAARLGKKKALPLACDITDPDQVVKLFAAIKRRHSTLDILVNNAGIAHGLAPVEQLSVDGWKQVIDTNLTGMFLCTRAALPLMQERTAAVAGLPAPGVW